MSQATDVPSGPGATRRVDGSDEAWQAPAMTDTDSILVHRDGMVATVELNDPPYNRLGVRLIDRLQRAVDELAADNAIRAVILCGAGGRNFSAGADIREFGALAGSDRTVRDVIEQRHAMIRQIETMQKPVICAIRGACMGGGLEIALGCHFRIASSDAKIGLPEIELGVLPAWGGTQRLTRVAGKARALEIMLRASKLSAAEALQDGIVHELCASAELEPRAAALAKELSDKAPIAVSGILQAVLAASEGSLEQGLEVELAALERVIASKDMQEGVTAFLQKRAPRFTGE